MPEKSIILHAHEIRRLLDAGEALIWRPIRPQPPEDATEVFFWWHDQFPEEACAGDGIWYWCPRGLVHHCKPRYGVPRERRWVKERFQVYDICYDDWAGGYEAGYNLPVIPREKPAYRVGISYAADGGFDGPWRSAVHMPCWASRLTVEILDVEARQVQSITEDEAREAGIRLQGCLARDKFARDWTRRYAKRGLGWDKNPWAWVMKLARRGASTHA